MSTYTVFAVYEDSLQPYAITVKAGNPEAAIRLAQIQCLEDNSAGYAVSYNNNQIVDYGSCTLVGFQVVAGEVATLPVDDMPFEVGQAVLWNGGPWTIKGFVTDAPELKAYVTSTIHTESVYSVPVRELTPDFLA